MHSILHLLALVLVVSYSTPDMPTEGHSAFPVRLDTLKLYDEARQRAVPIAIYSPETGKQTAQQQVVIFSHGYGANKGGDYLAYSYLTDFLASKGYVVVSIQHELPTDSLLPLEGNLQIVRRPFWDRGARNILFVINALKSSHPEIAMDHITLIGHSNGGDMTALFPQLYPDMVDRIITLDNRRVALPRTAHPKVCSLRSSDQPADEGVLPSADEISKWGMTITPLPTITHNEMDDSANDLQRKEIQNHILTYLNN